MDAQNTNSAGAVSFDLVANGPLTAPTKTILPEDVGFNPEISTKDSPPKEWEADVSQMISSRKWLTMYGLKKNRLDMNHLLPQIGFRHADAYDSSIKKPV